ncbi:InlB B-repeat-containing protein [Candidatus Villigracilis saccharophilus]|uniref:InlB B-repeat-containing protein n=1 Tax=Candidatus Villigracilis saccharophilus TaxID=3140684 RepID=UPI0031371F6C|nr:InlB B-repeat-containing protein [Anaerolineales bacterium]
MNSYTITFNSNGGSAVGAITQPFGSAVSAPTAPTKTGNTFGGWYSDAGLTTAYTFTTMPASDITLYAKWTVNSTPSRSTAWRLGGCAITQPLARRSALRQPTSWQHLRAGTAVHGTPWPHTPCQVDALPHTVTFNATGTGTMAPQVANVPTALTLNTFTAQATPSRAGTPRQWHRHNYTDGAIYSFAQTSPSMPSGHLPITPSPLTPTAGLARWLRRSRMSRQP